MKAKIELELEKEEDLNQIENELKAALNHTTHLKGDVQVKNTELIDK